MLLRAVSGTAGAAVSGGAAPWWAAALVHLAAYTSAVILLDPIASLLERTPFLRRLFGLSWTTRFRRYLAPGFDQER